MPTGRLVCQGGVWRYYANGRTTVRHHRRLDAPKKLGDRKRSSNVIFFKALVFGATLAIAIGPIALLIIDHAARGGLRMGLSSAFGAASGDLTYALVALIAGARVLPILMQQSARIQVGADLVLIVFGVWMAWSARHGLTGVSTESNASTASTTSAFRTTYVLTVINPLTVVAFMAFAPQLGMSSGSTALVAAAGLFVGSLLIQVGIALGGTGLKHVMSSRGARALNALSAGGIVAFGFIDLLR